MPDQRPNILIMHTDQQRFDTLGALGGDHAVTPNMDRLSRQGVTFARAYTSSPFCMPARHDLLTGTSARYHGYYQNQQTPIKDYGLSTLPRMLTEAGYQTMSVGKMHHYPEREHHGYNHMDLMEEIPSTWENDAYVQYLQALGYDVRCEHGVRPIFYPVPQISRVPEVHHGAAWVATRTNELLRRERNQPFFIFASWVGPHPPFYVPEKYLNLYAGGVSPDGTPLPPSRLAPDQEMETDVPPEKDVTQRWVRRFKEGYFARVTLIDTHVGRILDTLEETGLLENMLVIFMSDHGEMLGDRRHFSKTVPYEGSAHIPLIMAGPGVPGGVQATTAINTWDIAATVLDAAGIEVPEAHPLIGKSLLSLDWEDSDRIVITHLYENERRWIAAEMGDWKFIHFRRGGREELYSLDDDPWEQQNLIEDDRYRDIAGRLRDACLAFEREYGLEVGADAAGFVDLPDADEAPKRRVGWPFNWRQYPRWMNGYTDEDFAAMLQEMRDIIAGEEDIYIPTDEEWRERVMNSWAAIGGDRRALSDVLSEADALRGTDGWVCGQRE